MPIAIDDKLTSVFKEFDADDIIKGGIQKIAIGSWTGGKGILTQNDFHILEQATGSMYFLDIYQDNPNVPENIAEVQFSISYGTYSLVSSSYEYYSIYKKYTNILDKNNVGKFIGFDNTEIDNAIFIILAKDKLKESIDVGNLEIKLSNISGNPPTTQSLSLIDASRITINNLFAEGNAGKYYAIISGSIGNPYKINNNYVHYGIIYPEYGIIILDANKIANQLFGDYNNFINSNDGKILYTIFLLFKLGGKFQCRSIENINTVTYFVRIKNKEFNYSTNPTYYIDNNGKLRFSSFINDPVVYITTIGLYDDDNNLLAVAKLSKPLKKTFEREALIRIKLDF